MWSQEETKQNLQENKDHIKRAGCWGFADVPRENAAVGKMRKLMHPKHSCSPAILKQFSSREDGLRKKMDEQKKLVTPVSGGNLRTY